MNSEQKEQFCCHQTRFLGSKWTTNALQLAPPQTTLEELTLTALPQTPEVLLLLVFHHPLTLSL